MIRIEKRETSILNEFMHQRRLFGKIVSFIKVNGIESKFDGKKSYQVEINGKDFDYVTGGLLLITTKTNYYQIDASPLVSIYNKDRIKIRNKIKFLEGVHNFLIRSKVLEKI